MPYELPKGWVWIRLGEYFNLKSGISFNKECELVTGKYLYLKVGEMNNPGNEITITTTSIFLAETRSVVNSLIPPNSIIFPKRGGAIATNKKRLVAFPICVDTNIMAITCPNRIDIMFVYNWLLMIDLALLNSGTSVPQINNKDIAQLLLPLPPLAEQNRIVAKIDSLMSLCDKLEAERDARNNKKLAIHKAAIDKLLSAEDCDSFNSSWSFIARNFDTLHSVPQNVAELRKAILQLAVMGKLVPQDPHDEPASVLLAHIASEKAKLVKEGKLKKQDPLPPIKPEEVLYALPKGWVWVRLGEIAQSSLGKMLDRAKNRGEYKKYLRNLNVRWFDFDLNDMLEMRFTDDEKDQYSAIRGDVLICEGGYPGRSAIWDKDEPVYFQKAIHRVRFYKKDINKWFLNFIYLSHLNRNIENYFTGAGIQHFTGQSLKRFILPFPPLVEQKHIVVKTDKLMELCDALEHELGNSVCKQDAIINAVLAKV